MKMRKRRREEKRREEKRREEKRREEERRGCINTYQSFYLGFGLF